MASHAEPLASVPIVMAALPASASPRCAVALSRLDPPNDVTMSVAKPPNTANKVICALPMTLNVSTNRHGMTIVARTARIAAGTDHETRHQEPPCSPDEPAGAPPPARLSDGATALDMCSPLCHRSIAAYIGGCAASQAEAYR